MMAEIQTIAYMYIGETPYDGRGLHYGQGERIAPMTLSSMSEQVT